MKIKFTINKFILDWNKPFKTKICTKEELAIFKKMILKHSSRLMDFECLHGIPMPMYLYYNPELSVIMWNTTSDSKVDSINEISIKQLLQDENKH